MYCMYAVYCCMFCGMHGHCCFIVILYVVYCCFMYHMLCTAACFALKALLLLILNFIMGTVALFHGLCSFINHIACVIITIHSNAINPKLHGYNSLQQSNLQYSHAKIASQNVSFLKPFKCKYKLVNEIVPH